MYTYIDIPRQRHKKRIISNFAMMICTKKYSLGWKKDSCIVRFTDKSALSLWGQERNSSASWIPTLATNA